MPKFSVYVPDELWDEAQTVAPELNTSQLIQAGLRRYVEGEKPPRRPLPTAVLDQIEALRRRKVEQAERRYQNGFKTGLDLAAEWPWWGLDKLAGLNWDIPAWMRRLEEEDRNRRRLDQSEETEWWIALDIQEPDVEDFDEAMSAYLHESVFREGVQDALRAVWNAVRQDPLLAGAAVTATDGQPQPDAENAVSSGESE